SSRSDRLLLRGRSRVVQLDEPTVSDLARALNKALAGDVSANELEVESFRSLFNWPARTKTLARWLDELTGFPPTAPTIAAGPTRASLVIPARNRRALLRLTLRSGLAQSVPVEIIAMAAGSTDWTV